VWNVRDIAKVIIGDGVKSIGDYAFMYAYLREINIPSSVTTIGYQSFANCRYLTSVTLPDSLTTIEDMAFYMSALTSVIIPNSVTTIGGWAFAVTALTSVIIPNSVTTIGGAAFGCENLRFVSIGNSVTTIGERAFACPFLDTIICLANISPFLDTAPASSVYWAFTGVPKTIPVFVPCGSIAAYQTAFGWKEFTNYQAIGGEPLPAVPENVAVSQQNNALEVSWQSTNASNYEIYRNNVLLATVATTTYNDNNVANGVNYCYRINALYEPCVSGLSPEVCEVFSNVGIVETRHAASLRIYPNPNTGKLTVVGSQLSETGGEVEIYDVVGQVVSASAVFPQSTKIEIDISHLAAGLYFLKVDGKTYKVVKE
ncbi:MAG: leucine-rich repeat protein, partial [Lentimicrobiaceae bacterium]|nr:leucine-rich repeat protein [Lentimicrobiaceae bacterium]